MYIHYIVQLYDHTSDKGGKAYPLMFGPTDGPYEPNESVWMVPGTEKD